MASIAGLRTVASRNGNRIDGTRTLSLRNLSAPHALWPIHSGPSTRTKFLWSRVVHADNRTQCESFPCRRSLPVICPVTRNREETTMPREFLQTTQQPVPVYVRHTTRTNSMYRAPWPSRGARVPLAAGQANDATHEVRRRPCKPPETLVRRDTLTRHLEAAAA